MRWCLKWEGALPHVESRSWTHRALKYLWRRTAQFIDNLDHVILYSKHVTQSDVKRPVRCRWIWTQVCTSSRLKLAYVRQYAYGRSLLHNKTSQLCHFFSACIANIMITGNQSGKHKDLHNMQVIVLDCYNTPRVSSILCTHHGWSSSLATSSSNWRVHGSIPPVNNNLLAIRIAPRRRHKINDSPRHFLGPGW